MIGGPESDPLLTAGLFVVEDKGVHGCYAAATVSAVSGRPGNASGGRRLEAFDRFYEGVRKAGMPER